MKNKKRFLRQILALILAFELVFSPVWVGVAYAEGDPAAPDGNQQSGDSNQPVAESPSPAPSQSEPAPSASPESSPDANAAASPDPSADPSPSPSPTPQSTITTGDADSTAGTTVTANTTETTLPGQVTPGDGGCTPPEGETSCPSGTTITNDNSADVSTQTDSSSNSGGNSSSGSAGDATINTGDATAASTGTDTINSNAVILEPTPSPSASPESSPDPGTSIENASPSPSPSPDLTVANNNEATVSNDLASSATTGDNVASENLGDVEINSGNALAWVNLFNLLNTNIVGSDFEILLLDLLEAEGIEIDLNELWKAIEARNAGGLAIADGSDLSPFTFLFINSNQADLTNNVEVSADSGGNQAEGNDDVQINTGKTTALANVTNIVNTNIFGAKFFFGVINIIDGTTGDLILPRPERFASPDSIRASLAGQGNGAVFENDNQAETEDSVVAGANSGNNQSNGNGGDNLMETGEASSLANIISFMNLNIQRNNWFFLIINNLGGWSGKIFGWSDPTAEEEQEEGSEIYQTGFGQEGPGGTSGIEGTNGDGLVFANQNEAMVRNNIRTSASSGGNLINDNRGNVALRTGRARSAANLFNLINTNILGGRFFMGIVNILGNWTGNAIFAYPDLAVSLSGNPGQAQPGETVEYLVSYQNQGHDLAGDAQLRLTLPAGLIYAGDSSGFTPSVAGQTVSWGVGSVPVGQGGSFSVTVQIDPQFDFGQELSFLEKLIPVARAAENEKEKPVTVMALVSTSDPESNTGNQSASTTTMVYLPKSETTDSEGGEDQRQPILEISAWNNVNEFVYPGDTVTFEIIVRNKSDVSSYNTYLTQKLYNGIPEDFGTAEFYIGEIPAGKTVKLSFGIKLADGVEIPDGEYHTVAQAFGKAPNGNDVSSNQATTDFVVKYELSLMPAAIAKDEETGAILGGQQNQCKENKEDLFPYILLMVVSSLWIVNSTRRFAKNQWLPKG